MTRTFSDEQTAALLEALGLQPDTDDAQLVVDTAADLAAQAAGMNPEQPSTVAAAARRHGLELVDHDTHEALKRDAAEGRKIAAAAARAKVEAAVDDAVNKGKITPARRKHWVESYRGRRCDGRRVGRGACGDRSAAIRSRPQRRRHRRFGRGLSVVLLTP